MIRIIFLTDFTETYSHSLLLGVQKYAKEQSQESWVICRMPPSYKQQYGIEGVVQWALNWKANAIIGRFEQNDNIELLLQHGIAVIAQDFKQRFNSIPNITGDYIATGEMAARFFLQRGFKYFAFLGYRNIVWSDERLLGYKQEITQQGINDNIFIYDNQRLDSFWFDDLPKLSSWIKNLPSHTALFCCDDNQANNALEVCKLLEVKVPHNIAILGVDNDKMIADLSDPKLSTIRLDIEKGGYETAQFIAKTIKNKELIRSNHNIYIKPISVISNASSDIFATKDKYILDVLEYIKKNISQPINVKDILTQVPLSRRLLEIRFKEATGTSIYHYIIECKIDLFSSLLECTNLPIYTIISQLGINNYSSFSQLFKARKGCTPHFFRNRNK
ncbi:MAG: AraC family transcriptional regulator [Prevotella sp.]